MCREVSLGRALSPRPNFVFISLCGVEDAYLTRLDNSLILFAVDGTRVCSICASARSAR